MQNKCLLSFLLHNKFINIIYVLYIDIAILQTFNTEFSTLEIWLEKSSLYLENLFKDNTDNIETAEHKTANRNTSIIGKWYT